MHYVTSDIHNDNQKLEKLLKHIGFSEADHLYIVGDLFDRADYAPDPVGVYFNVLKLGERCTVIRGNHDVWLAEYILKYYNMPEKKRVKARPYEYNSFELLSDRVAPVDMLELAYYILSCPLHVELSLGEEKYLLAHAATTLPEQPRGEEYYLMGDWQSNLQLENGVYGYISICGHQNLGGGRIWKNKSGTAYVVDCGCGFESGRLACLCLETKEEFYV